MNLEFEGTRREDVDTRNPTRRILFLAAVISTVFGVLYLLGLTGKLIVDGSIHSVSAPPIQMLSAAIGLLWDISLLIMFVALRRQIASRNAVYADLALVFMALLCATSSINWFVQLTLVPRISPTDDPNLLALVDIHRVSSVMYAIEHLAWGVFYGLATIFMAMAIRGGRVETWIRWLFGVGGVLSILHVFGIMTGVHALIDLGYFAAGVLLPITTLLLAVRFRRD
jgi:hypothetical protein